MPRLRDQNRRLVNADANTNANILVHFATLLYDHVRF